MRRGGWVALTLISLGLGWGHAARADDRLGYRFSASLIEGDLPPLPRVDTLHYRLAKNGTSTEQIVDADNQRARIEVRDQNLPHDANVVSITIRVDDPAKLSHEEYRIDPRNKTITQVTINSHDESIDDFLDAYYPNQRQLILDEEEKGGRVVSTGNELVDGINTVRCRWDDPQHSDSQEWWLLQRGSAWIPFQHRSAGHTLEHILDVRFNEPIQDSLFILPSGYAITVQQPTSAPTTTEP